MEVGIEFHVAEAEGAPTEAQCCQKSVSYTHLTLPTNREV